MHGFSIRLQVTKRGWFPSLHADNGTTAWDGDTAHATAAQAAEEAETILAEILGQAPQRELAADAAWRVGYYSRLLDTDTAAPAWQRAARKRLLSEAQKELANARQDRNAEA